MTKQIFIATDPNGIEHRRTSDRRTYTHTVVFQKSKKLHIESAIAGHKQHVSTGEWMLACVANGKHLSLMHFDHYAKDIERQARDVTDCIEKLNGAKNAVEYADRQVTETVADLESRDWSVYWNAGWCGRADLAQKLAASITAGLNVTILPATVFGRAKAEVR